MTRKQNPNIEILMFAVERLDELADEMVFLGGCATGLLITDDAAPPIRVTRDVDAIVQVVSRTDYYQLSEKLRAKGLKEDISEDAPICRWIAENIILDVMPTDTRILGFGNKWYASAMKYSVLVQLPSGKKIRMVSGPYFLITKLEAFDGRGGGDYQMSHDIEDIIAVLDGRSGLIDEVKRAEPSLVKELAKRFHALLNNSHFIDAVSGHMPTDEISQERVTVIKNVIKELAGLK
jgi:predicted nucleotidyltransferase